MDRTKDDDEETRRKSSVGTLYVVGTPIGNLEDLSPRARQVLGRVEVVAAEDTRRTGRLLSTIGGKARLISAHEHNERERVRVLLEVLREGRDVALVSDAGMPLVSDPGWVVVHAALAAGIPVQTVPGPSAVTAALCVSGLPTDRFVFEGFLPRRASARAARLQSLAHETRTLVFFESVHRVRETIAALAEHLGEDRAATVARELTKVHEQVFAGSLREIAAALGAEVPELGEFVIVVGGAEAETSGREAEALRVFGVLCKSVPADEAVALTAELTGMARNAVYRLTRLK
ncbi:MAG TPA: 16S rRNA (cytidine(1402)-2'-O)-methyltransferase [Gammaproteobacteria bacterium]|nr:16S rRNA (cytidine(1402)-2'-O)-methyltransferase [Gammaproteobacteria bacterium]